MSKGSTPIKVLRTALKRIQKGWTQGTWSAKDSDGNVFVCLEGALFGFCNEKKHGLTDAQKKARDVVVEVIKERYPRYDAIPSFNDAPDRTQAEVEEVTKLALIRLETGGGNDEASSEEDFDDLLEFMDS